MQFTTTTLLSATLFASVAFANEVVTTDGQTITYVDITTTPEVTKSVVSTVLSTSTPHITTTLSKKVSSSSPAQSSKKVSSSSPAQPSKKQSSSQTKPAQTKSHSDLVQNVSQIGDGQIQATLQVSQQTAGSTSSTNLPQVDIFSAAGNNLIINNGIAGMVMAGLALL